MTQSTPERWHVIAGRRVDLTRLELPGPVLDIGGGGEGIIGRVLGERVVAVDPLRQELEETPVGPLKIVMDARDLKFLDAQFGAATAFFTMMYIARADHEKVFAEVARVLQPAAPFVLWDVAIPAELPAGKEAIVVRPEIGLSGGTLSPGYGVNRQGHEQDLAWFEALAGRTGFEVARREQDNELFRLDLRRRSGPAPARPGRNGS